MVEAALFLAVAWLMTRTKTWNRKPHLSDYVHLIDLVTSALDSGPLRFTDETVQEDPNSTPDYIWYERSS